MNFTRTALLAQYNARKTPSLHPNDQDVASKIMISNKIQPNNNYLLYEQCKEHEVFKSEKCEGKIKQEPEESVTYFIQCSSCSGESQASQIIKTEPSYEDHGEDLDKIYCNQFDISSCVQCGMQTNRDDDGVNFLTRSPGCYSEPQTSYVITAKLSDQDQIEDLFSFADLAGHVQSLSSTQYSHNVRQNDSMNQNRDSKNRQVTKTNSCDQCNKSFRSTECLVVHDRTHISEKPFSFSPCNKSFNQSRDFVVNKGIHTGEKRYSCDQCSKSFSTSGTLVVHKRTHTGKNVYISDQYNKSFSQAGEKVVCKRTHTDCKLYSCDQCNKSFHSIGHLVVHNRIHTGEKPFNCQQRNKSFRQPGDLVVHKRIHTGERPYSCDQCNKSFRRSGHLVVHKRTHTGEKPYSCEASAMPTV